MGYGRNPIAQMSGQKLKKVDSKMIDINGDRTVDGWEYKWDAWDSKMDNSNIKTHLKMHLGIHYLHH
ncbi:Protein of unknown function [Bacillus wiedmannii]|nr:Protein of unknown function [Bacillus wiedmannii]